MERRNVPVADSNSAGVIMEVSTAMPFDKVENSGLFQNCGKSICLEGSANGRGEMRVGQEAVENGDLWVIADKVVSAEGIPGWWKELVRLGGRAGSG